MGIRKLKPVTPGQRQRSVSTFEHITESKPEKSLLAPLKRKGGRNNTGRMMVRHQGGGHKRRYRKIDFKRNKFGVPARVATIEYDPNRSARIALLVYADGDKRYIIAPDNCTSSNGEPKASYRSKRDAVLRSQIIREVKGLELNVYACPLNRGWHLTRG